MTMLENYSSHSDDALGIVELLTKNGFSHLADNRGCVRVFDYAPEQIQVIIYDLTSDDYNDPVAILSYSLEYASFAD